MTNFKQAIRAKIADAALQSALDANTTRRLNGRAAAIASLPDWNERRQRAHAIRAEVIEHLDEYIAHFIAKVQSNGIHVHRAKDAAEAVQIVLNIVGATGSRSTPVGQSPLPGKLIAKSKSMVSEEIGLNHALEAAGHRVVETDLGEYIIQLRHERPSHIITPAVHLNRRQVGELFHEKLGIPLTEDIPILTNTARKVLREVFLTAEIGISGVNFGVAETGSLCIVTNEGNGRMCTTLPPTHIALMGMERLVPSLDDLALFLSLLPRSATGQKLSVYTQLIQRPLEHQTRHLVIVDNGRERLRQSPLHEALYCIRCGACLNACPVFRELGGHAYVGTDGSIAPYPGPIGSVISPGLIGLDTFGHLAQASTLCGACKEACPVDIDLPKMLTRVRAGEVESRMKKEGIGLPAIPKLFLWMYSRVASHPGLFAVAQKGMALGARLVSPFRDWMSLPAFTGWGYSKDLPRPALKTFRDSWKEMESGKVNLEASNLVDQEKGKQEIFEKSETAFATELAALGGRVINVSSSELSNHLISFLKSRDIDAVQMWDSVPALSDSDLAEAKIRVVRSLDESLKVGITGALAAIHNTGTLILPSGPSQPLTASLVPPIHIAVLRAADIYPTLEAAIRLPEIAAAELTVLITGPSRTADIEMTLTIGVHGPGELIVYIVDD